MTAAPRLGVLGGTFDPIHLGHLSSARAAQEALHLDAVRLVPSSQPPHRPDNPRASGYHRFAMTALAVAGVDGWEACDLELTRSGPSYTFDTLTALHQEGWAASQLFFITGADAFAEISTWSRYPAVLDLAHFVVIARPGIELQTLRHSLPALAPRMSTADAPLAGPSIVLVPASTPDVSSTDIRRRAAAGEPIEGLVPDAVAAHILRHRLYRQPRSDRKPPA
jgi:nicotinate-nucleotide adenylyltransferase